jgi:hypothetical protein
MKKILIAIALCFGLYGNSQVIPPPGYTPMNQGMWILRVGADGLNAPAGTTPTLAPGQTQRAGAIYVDSTGADSGFYYRGHNVFHRLLRSGEATGLGYNIFNQDSIIIDPTDSVRQITIAHANKLLFKNPGASYPEVRNISPYTFVFRDTVTSNDYYSAKRHGFYFNRETDLTSGVQRQYLHGAELGINFRTPDSARLNPTGGDAVTGVTHQLIFQKQSGVSRSVLVTGIAGASDPTSATLSNVLFAGNSIRTRGALAAHTSYLNIPTGDTAGFYMGYHSRAVSNGNKHKIIDYWAGLGGATNADSVYAFVNPWVNARSVIGGDLMVGLRAGYPIPGQTTGTDLNPIIGQFNDPSAILQIESTTKGFLLPRMTQAQREAIAAPATGLEVYQTDGTSGKWYYDGIAWNPITSFSMSDSLTSIAIGNLNAVQQTVTYYDPTFIGSIHASKIIGAPWADTASIADSVEIFVRAPLLVIQGSTNLDGTQNGDTLYLPFVDADSAGALTAADYVTLMAKQAALVSGTNIKTINGNSILGSGDLVISGGGAGTVNTGSANRLAYYAGAGTTVDDLAAITASRALISDANGLPTHAVTTATELGYVNGVTSAIQTQIDGKQAGDADLTAIAALSGTNNIYYRSAANTWTSVTVGSGLSFSSGTLSASGGGGSGDVVGPASATDNALALFDGTTGKLIKNSVFLGSATQITVPDGAGIVIGDATKQTVGSAYEFQVLGTTSADAGALIGMYSTTDASFGALNIYKSANATIGGQTVVVDNEALGAINFWGHQETSAATANIAASIRAFVDNTVTSGSAGDMPGRLEFFITPNASGTPASELTLTSAAFIPTTSSGVSLGTAANMWAGVFLGAGQPVSFAGGDVTISPGTNLLSFLSATNGYRFDNTVSPTTDDGASLGSTALQWGNLFGASGFVFNFNNGAETITHGTDAFTIAGAKLLAAASATGFASINIPDGVDPTSPVNGDIWQESNHFYGRLNGVTYQLDQQGGSGTVTQVTATDGNGFNFTVANTTTTPVISLETTLSDNQIAYALSGDIVGGNEFTFGTSSNLSFLSIGSVGVGTGNVNMAGFTSGSITIKPQAAAGTYNFNLPTSAGSSGQPLLSGGGGSTAMTFGTLGVGAGGTGATATPTNGQLLIGNGTNFSVASLTSSNSSITITPGSGTLNIATTVTLAQGSYTPTITNVSNVTGTTASTLYWYRVGDRVTVFGELAIDPTTLGQETSLRFDLPVSSALADNGELAGSGVAPNGSAELNPMLILADATNDAALINYTCITSNNTTWNIHFSYIITGD